MPAGPLHGEIACASGIVDYLTAAHAHHFPVAAGESAGVHAKVKAMMALGHAHEVAQTNRILDLLRAKGVRIIGNQHAATGARAPTIAFTTDKWRPVELAERLSEQRIGIGSGHFYAYRLMGALGIEPRLASSGFRWCTIPRPVMSIGSSPRSTRTYSAAFC